MAKAAKRSKRAPVFPDEITVVLEDGGTENEWLNARRNGLEDADVEHGQPVAIYRRVAVGYASVEHPKFTSKK